MSEEQKQPASAESVEAQKPLPETISITTPAAGHEHSLLDKTTDEEWYRDIYQGDHVPQLTFRAVLMGGILGALILTVLTTLLTLLQMPEGFRRMLFGAIVLLVTAVYLRIVEDR